MSRISAKSSAATATKLLKQFGGWATGLTDNYRSDIFFRTQCNIIVLQFLFVILMIFIFGAILNYAERDLTDSLVRGIVGILETGGAISGEDVLELKEAAKARSFVWAFISITTASIIFGFIVSVITLTPARTALEAQKRFIGNIAHELRTPLSVIKTNAEVALLNPNLEKNMKSMLESNVVELNRASEIINNLLSLNHFVRAHSMELSNVDLGEVVDRAVSKLEELANHKHIEITVRKSDYRTVWGNAVALEQVALNLAKNALNYTPEGGRVAISIEPDYLGAMALTVKDSGIGIAQKDLFHIFEPFYRVDKSRTRMKGGSGLGLSIVSEIVKIHHGKISVKSAVGKGTTVTVLLPAGSSARTDASTGEGPSVGEISVDFARNM